MGYKMNTANRWAKTRSAVLQAAVTNTATANGAAIELGDQNVLRLSSVVTAASGTTPSLTVKVQTSRDGSTNWTDVPNGAFAAQTAAGTALLVCTGLDRFVRIVSTISGTTPSFTYSVSGESA